MEKGFALRGLPAFPTEPPYDDEFPRAEPPAGPFTRRALASGGRRGPATAGSSRGRTARSPAGPNRGPGDVRLPAAPTTPPVRIPRQARDSRLRENPRPAATIVVRAIVEVLTGARPVTHLAGWATPSLLASLERFGGAYPGRGTVRSIRIGEPRPGVAEVTAVIARSDRVAALALRMEATDGRWQVTTLQIG